MIYKNISGTDLKASAICLGSSSFGSTVAKEAAFELMDMFFGEGGNFLDTANVYADWLPVEKSISEKTIGKWIKERGLRNKILIGTKGGHPNLSTMHISRMSKEEVIHDLDQSLNSLQTDYIDLYWLHRDDESRPVEYILETMNEQVKAGKIRYFGCSNWRVPRMEEARQYAAKAGMMYFAGSQVMWSLASPNTDSIKDKTMVAMDDGMLDYHKKTGLSVIPYGSQANGFFTKLESSDTTVMREGVRARYCNDENIKRLARIKKLASELSVSTGEIVLGYLTSQPFITIPVVGCKNIEHLKNSLRAGDLVLSPEMLDFLQFGT